MAYTLSLSQSQSLAALRTVLLTALPSGLEIIQGEDSRVAEPVSPNFVIFWPITRTRLATNINSYQDCAFAGRVDNGTPGHAGTVLTVSSVSLGTINTAALPPLYGPSVAAGTQILAQTSGTIGGAGTYTISASQSVASGPLAAGMLNMMQPTQLTVQTDVHGPLSGDNVQVISTLLRSGYACDLFSATGYDVTPLYCGDPRQMPWQDAEAQIEKVWSCDVSLQVNSIVFLPQQFFGALSVTVEPPIA